MNEREIDAGLAQTPGYRYADRVGDQLYVAGQVPHDHEGVLVGVDDPSAQADRCLHNLRLVVEQHDFRVADIRSLTIYVVGPRADLSAAWAAVRSWFGGEVPPATLLGVAALGHAGQVVEIDATIVRG